MSAGLVAAAVLAAVEVGQLVLQHRSLTIDGASLSYGALLGSTTWGMAWLVRSQSVLGLLLALLLARRARGAWYGLALAIAALALVGITAGTSLSGHAASVVPRIPAVLTDMVHLLSVGTWVGTLGLLLMVALPLLRSDASTALIAVRAFSRVAMVAVALMLLTGVLSASNHLGSWNAVFESTYGRVLLGKLAVVFVVLAIGARNQLRVRNDGVSASERISSISSLGRVELISAIIVLLVTAVLVASPTPPTALH